MNQVVKLISVFTIVASAMGLLQFAAGSWPAEVSTGSQRTRKDIHTSKDPILFKADGIVACSLCANCHAVNFTADASDSDSKIKTVDEKYKGLVSLGQSDHSGAWKKSISLNVRLKSNKAIYIARRHIIL